MNQAVLAFGADETQIERLHLPAMNSPFLLDGSKRKDVPGQS